MKRLFLLLFLIVGAVVEAGAVLKEKDLEQTLSVLRQELVDYHLELTGQAGARKKQNQQTIKELMETMRRSNQNSLMLYSQKTGYVFDLTYACHEATALYQQFQDQQVPFRSFLEQNEVEIAKFDSLIVSLKVMRMSKLSQQAMTDRNVCLTLATSIRNTIEENRTQTAEYIRIYELTEQRLKYLNDYANQLYNDIQMSIFRNGGVNYFTTLRYFKTHWENMKQMVSDKYKPTRNSDWDSRVIFGLFFAIGVFAVISILLNLLVFRLMPRRFHTPEFLRKRACIIWATTTITFALLLGVLRATLNQNFFIMASGLLIEYSWLLGVILISLLLRVNGQQIRSAFRIYAPLLVVGFLVIGFRIILIPNELVNLIFPPILLLCTLWQWNVIGRHNKNVPRQDMIYSYISLMVFFVSVTCSWMSFTLLAVQILIWWIMQLTCILTITFISSWLQQYGQRHGFGEKPITQSWFYLLIYNVLLPTLGVLSVMISFYWAAGVFNMSDLCWKMFSMNIINQENLQISILKLTFVVCLWFFFSYASRTILALMRLHFETTDPSTAASREVMGKNVIQVLIWGVWLLMSLSVLHISVSWLLAISGGLSTGIGFASKDIIENIYYGASLMAGRIKVGDWIEVDGTMGKVSSISYTSTVVESLRGEVITFQNSQLFAKNYKNLTRNHGYVLAVIPFGVAYGSNLKQVTELVENAVNSLHHEWMDPNKQVKSVMAGMGDSSVDFKLFVWADAVKKSYVISDVLKCVYNTLYENGIEIPFPQRDIHIRKD